MYDTRTIWTGGRDHQVHWASWKIRDLIDDALEVAQVGIRWGGYIDIDMRSRGGGGGEEGSG